MELKLTSKMIKEVDRSFLKIIKSAFSYDLIVALLIVTLINIVALLIDFFSHAHSLAGFCSWDCVWYRRIGTTGYQLLASEHPGKLDHVGWQYSLMNPYAFWPLFPTLARYLSKALLISFEHGAQILNSFSWALASVFAVRVIDIQDKQSRLLAIGFFLSFPFSFYAYVPMSESIYGLLTIAFIYCLKRDLLITAGIVGGVLSSSRPTAVPVIALLYVIKFLMDFKSGKLNFVRICSSVLTSSVGFFLWVLYQYLEVGDPLEFLHVEAAWNREYTGALHNISGIFWPWEIYWKEMLFEGRIDFHFCGLVAFLAVLLSLYGMKRKLYFLSPVVLLTVVLAYSYGTDSVIRYVWGSSATVALLTVLFNVLKKEYRVLVLCFLIQIQQLLFVWWQHSPWFLM